MPMVIAGHASRWESAAYVCFRPIADITLRCHPVPMMFAVGAQKLRNKA
jgi:hypothetical protein